MYTMTTAFAPHLLVRCVDYLLSNSHCDGSCNTFHLRALEQILGIVSVKILGGENTLTNDWLEYVMMSEMAAINNFFPPISFYISSPLYL